MEGSGDMLERKENHIFVRNLAYQTTSQDLTGLFEEYGPVKRATIVQENGISKGYGFVKFALTDDARVALESLQGKELHGRALKLEVAVQRGQSTKGANEENADDNLPTAPKSSVNSILPLRHLQLVVIGVPSHLNKKIFRDSVLKYIPFKCKKLEVDLLKQDHPAYTMLCPEHILPQGRIMILTAPSRKDVPLLAETLDNISCKALGLNTSSDATQIGSGPKSKLFCRPLKDVTPCDSRKQKCRLILRNLSFQATEENIATRLLKFGPIVEVTIPRVEVNLNNLPSDGSTKGISAYAQRRFEKRKQGGQSTQLKPRGFAFVTFLCEQDATKAVNGSEGLRICNREFALDFCQHKYGYGFSNEDVAKEEHDTNINDDSCKISLNESDGSDKEEETMNDDEKSDVEKDDDNASDYSGEDVKIESDSENESEPGSEMEWDGSDSEDNENGNQKSSKKKDISDVNEKKTVFIRDLAFDANEADVKKVLRQFGPIEFAVIVRDKVTKTSKGTAFVKFETQEAALNCVESCERLPGTNMALSSSLKLKVNSNTRNSDMPLGNIALTLKGRPFRVDLAVDREEAKRLKDDSISQSGKDKRNLYLANEGLLVDSSVSFKRYGDAQKSNNDMSDADREKRRRAQTEKKKKLVNPLYFVSPTRLSIRNLKKTVNHSQLFSLCYKAAKSGLRNGLVEKKDMENYLIAQSVPIRQRTSELLALPGMEGVPQNELILKAKVMLDSSRLRGANKAAQSRGYGFVEFKHHAHALACLRELNHNPVYGKEYATQFGSRSDKLHNLIVEFSLENFQKVKILNSRIEKRNLNNENLPNVSDDDDEDITTASRKRPIMEECNDEADDMQESEDDTQENNAPDLLTKKSRFEKKLERAQKRKAKELKRKENKKRKLIEVANKHGEKVESRDATPAEATVKTKKAWGGHKRHRAKTKGK